MKRKSLLLIIASMLMVFLVACGGSAAEPAVEEEADAGPKIFTWAEPTDPFDIDPRTSYDGQGLPVIAQAYETLTHFNALGSEEEISPELATSWSSSEDGTVWTFELREGVKFHDGADFNAEAVKALVENVRDGDLATSWIFGAIIDIQTPAEYTIEFTTEFPSKLDLVFSSAFGAWMVSPNALGNGAEWFAEGNTAGTGPYMITSRETGARIVMERFEDYWQGWNDNKFDTVVFEYVGDATTREQMVRAGDADLTRELDYENLESLESADGVTVKVEPAYKNQFIMLNNARPPLDNPLVRQALSLSYPYDDAVANLVGGNATPAGGAIPGSMWGSDSDAAVSQDLDKARELLAEAGFADGFEMDYWAYEGTPTDQQIGEIWLPILRDLGITLNITVIDFNAAMDAFWNDPATAHHAVGLNWFPTYVTPFDPMFSPFATEEYFNVAAYSNFDFEDLLFYGDELTATDQAAAIEVFQEANQMLIDDAPAIFVFDFPEVWTMRDDLSGYYYSPAYGTEVPVYELERN